MAGPAVLFLVHLAHAQQPTPRPGTGPFPAMPDPVHFPVLGYRGREAACASAVSVQNIGDEPGQAALLAWGDEASCGLDCAGPRAIACSGLLRPGASWVFAPEQLAPGTKSAVVYSFNARRLTDIGLEDGGAQLVADRMCDSLRRLVVGDCDDYYRFKLAFESGGSFDGVALSRAYGPAIAAVAQRQCIGNVNKVLSAGSDYAGVSGPSFGGFDRVFGASSYHATVAYGGQADDHTYLYVQNGGDRCASVAVFLQDAGTCHESRLAESFLVAQGASVTVDVADHVGPDWVGNAWLNSTQPLAIAVDVAGRDALMTYIAVPAELRYSFDGPPLFSEGSPVAYAPLALGPAAGWQTRVHVQNLSSDRQAWVNVRFLDASGAAVAPPLLGAICPRGSRSFDASGSAGAEWALGSVRVECYQGTDERGIPGAAPNISAVAEMVRMPDPAPGDAPQRVAYNLLSEQQAFDWPVGHDHGGAESGTTLIALPDVSAAVGPPGSSSELVVANLVGQTGATNVVVQLYDQNGLVGATCRQLHQLEVAVIDAGDWAALDSGFRGSAIVSATAWRHPVYARDGRIVRNLVGLAALVLHQGLDDGQPERMAGDTAAATTGIPIRSAGAGLRSLVAGAGAGVRCPPPPASVPSPTPDPLQPLHLPIAGRR